MEGKGQINKAIMEISLEIIETIEARTNVWPSNVTPET